MMRDDDSIEFGKKATLKANPRLQVDRELVLTLGIDLKHFNKVLDNLCVHWWDAATSLPDCVAQRLVSRVLSTDLEDPLIISIIGDNVESFKKHYNKEKGDIDCFELCCLCGAEKIIQNVFLKDKEMAECLMESDNAIGYALSSGKKELAMSLAVKAVELGKENPGLVTFYALGDFTSSAAITDLFSRKNSNDPSFAASPTLSFSELKRNPRDSITTPKIDTYSKAETKKGNSLTNKRRPVFPSE